MTTIVGALQALATNKPHAVRMAIGALGDALDLIRVDDAKAAEATQGANLPAVKATKGGRRAS